MKTVSLPLGIPWCPFVNAASVTSRIYLAATGCSAAIVRFGGMKSAAKLYPGCFCALGARSSKGNKLNDFCSSFGLKLSLT